LREIQEMGIDAILTGDEASAMSSSRPPQQVVKQKLRFCR